MWIKKVPASIFSGMFRLLGSSTAMRSGWLVIALFFSQVIWSVWSDYQNTLDSEYENLGVRVRLVEAELSGSFRSLDLFLRALGDKRIKDRRASVESFRHELQDALGLIPEISGLFLTNAQGIVKINTDSTLEGDDSSQRDYYRYHAQSVSPDRGLFVSKSFKETSGRQIFTVSRALRSTAGEFLGVIVARLEINTFAEVFRPLVPAETGALTLIFTDGEILFRWPDPERFIGKNVSKGIAFSEHIASGKQETSHRTIALTDSVDRLLLFRRLVPDSLTVTVSRDMNEVTARWRQNTYQKIVELVLIVVIIAFYLFAIQRRQREIERAQKFAEGIIKMSPIGICIYDSEGQCISANEAMVKHVGGTMVGVLAQNYHQIEAWKKSGIYELACQTQRTGEKTEKTIHVKTSFGRDVWLGLTFNLLETDGRMMLSSYDLSEFKQEQLVRQEAEEQYRTLIAVIPEGVVLQDENSVIIAHNQSAERILGLSSDQLHGRTSLDPRWRSIHEDGSAFPGETHPVVMTLKTGLPQTDVIMGIHKPDGELTWISISVQPIFKEGKTTPYRVVATMHDVTERKQREKEAVEMREQIAQATKMESVGHLTAGIAHDFNNILGAIMGYTELSQQVLASGKTDALGRYQEEVLRAANRAKQLIAQMLTFSRLSPEVEGVHPPVTVLSPIVKEVVSLLRSSIPSTIDLNCSIANEDWTACIQPIHLHQIILNLGVNARDAIGEYGKIDISLSHYHGEYILCSACKNSFSGDYTQITVRDSGSGIPDHVLNKIFDPFFTTKGVGKGTGMGLSVVHGLVHALGGHILVESSTEGGTSFNILLPLASSAAGATESSNTAPMVNIKGLRILVVDDEQALSTMQYEFLTSHGAHIDAFTDPVRALESFVQNVESIDLVITDESMPGMSGMLLARKLLNIKPGLPIILCTGYSDHATPESAAEIGIAGFFHKPLNMNELMQKIQALRGMGKQL